MIFKNKEIMTSTTEKSQGFINITFLSGLISGCLNKFITHPIDTLKAKIQISQIKYSNLKNISKDGIINTSKRVLKTEGIKGFYKGVSIACVK